MIKIRDLAIAVVVSTATTLTMIQYNAWKEKRRMAAKAEKDAESPTAKVFPTKQDVATNLCTMIVEWAKTEIASKGSFVFAVAGGSVLDTLTGLVAYSSAVDWSQVTVAFVNHKCIPLDHEKASVAVVKKNFCDALGIRKIIVPTSHPMNGSDGSLEAKYYAKQMVKSGVPYSKKKDGMPIFDLVLLGLGVDGHVGSNHPMSLAVKTTNAVVVPSPKAGEPSSITLSIPAINAAKRKVFVVTGGKDGKKEAVKKAMIRPYEGEYGSFPAQLISGPLFLLDKEAAADL